MPGLALWVQVVAGLAGKHLSRKDIGTMFALEGHDYVRQGRHNQLADLSGPMLGACLLLAERDRGSLAGGSPVRRLPVGLSLLEDPIRRLG